MSTLTSSQLSQYLAKISFPGQICHAKGSLEHLAELQKYHLAAIPFSSIALHYSKNHLLSLDPDDLFHKLVVRGLGGYCMENNALFGTVLRTIGFIVFNAGGRVSDATAGRPGPGFMGWSHMVNIVTIEHQRYLVDVGFGADDASRPLPLIDGHICTGIAPQSLRLEYKALAKHTDKSQRVWVYSHRNYDDAPWVEAYSFLEIEFFREDYEVMNLHTMTTRTSYFVQTVLCMTMTLGEEKEGRRDFDGILILYQNQVKKRIKGETYVLETMNTEEQRVKALEKWFGIILTEVEKKGIESLATELRGGLHS